MTSEDDDQLSALATSGREALAQRRPDVAEVLLRRALALSPEDASLHADLGRALNNLRRHDAAEMAFRASLALHPDDAQVHFYLGHVLHMQQRLDDAQVQFERACALDADMARARQALGGVLARRGRLSEASRALRHALQLQPGHLPTLLNLAAVLEVSGRGSDAIEVYEEALDCAPNNAAAHTGLAGLLQSRGDITAASRHYAKVLAFAPDDEQAIAGLAAVHEMRGDIEAGWQLVAPRLDRGDAGPDLCHIAARLRRRQGRHRDALSMLDALRADGPPGWATRPQLYFTLGEIYDELGDVDAAFANFARANALSAISDFEPSRHRALVDRTITFFGSPQSRALPPAAAHPPIPVFIVGMPRSGTSLVEQILASHPGVQAGGERLDVPRVAAELADDTVAEGPYPLGLSHLTQDALIKATDRYRVLRGETRADSVVATDKLPVNFMHLGLIELLLPNARVIHCRRQPLDTMLSIYFQNFNPQSQPFASSLEHIAAYYEEYLRLMAHWRDTLGLPLYELDYERLIEAQEPVTRDLLDFVELPWDERCLRFFDTPREITTASYAQVRKPLYTSSVGRHRRYLRHLGELAERFSSPPGQETPGGNR